MQVHRISPEEAVHLLANDDIDLVDVREPEEWASGHIPGARHVPLGSLLRDPLGGLRPGRARAIFVCAHGIRSLTAAAAAAQRGCEKAYNLEGGLVAWTDAGLPVERG
ncbi:MAG: rhodanese-like domain-containing protein [Deltaproteobacteria bacterium]